MSALAGLIGVILAFLIGMFFSKKKSQTDAQVLDLTNKIAQKQKDVQDKQAIADQKVKEYEDSLKALNNKPPTT